ncbi:MAG: arsenate reductase (glutaredoxin) [Halieaceae bacterium]|jgi:arsenate reductase (glutaredoxin)|nr:arsenate reductase (glutaredoxin) [Halieaceae bacterium]
MSVRIYHNPRCSKSRASLQLLNDKGIEPEIVLYLDVPPSIEELKDVVAKLGLGAGALIRYNEDLAKELGIAKSDQRSEHEWLALMNENPVLIERPIIVSGNKAVIGRPPENINDIV